MDQRDALLTIGEIAAAFIGFSTIVVVFRSSRSELQRLRLRGVAEIGIAVLVGAFLPILASGLGLSGGAVWRVSSAVFAPVSLMGWMLWARTVAKSGHQPTFGRTTRAPDVWANLTGQILLWWNVIAPSAAAPTRYVAALMAFLLIAAMSFVSSAFARGAVPNDAGSAETG